MSEEITLDGLTISTQVLVQVVTNAADKVEGVAYVNGHNLATALTSLFIQRTPNLEERIEIEQTPDGLIIDIPVAVFFGYPFPQIAEELRASVAELLRTQVGVEATEINVRINELIFPKE